MQYLKYSVDEDQFEAIDYKHWQVGLGRTQSSIRLWYVLRAHGIRRMQENVREKIELSKVFEDLVQDSKYFSLVCDRQLSLVCFRYTGGNEAGELGDERDLELNRLNEKLTEEMTKDTTMGFIVGG
jgi:aromatic-L-amino-acid decarboxylase